MDSNPSFRRDHCLRPYSDRVKVLRFLLTGIEFMLRLGSAYRIYAITGKNKLIGGALALVVAAELCSGIFSTIWIGLGPCEFLSSFSVRV